MINEKHFPKPLNQWEFDYGLFTNLPRIIVACDFSSSSFKLKRGILLYWQNKYPNLKTTCHIMLKFFLWTKFLKSLHLAKYLISVAATLIVLHAYRSCGKYSACYTHISQKLHQQTLQVQTLHQHQLHAFVISNTFISNAILKFAKNQANDKQHPEAEL